MDVPQCDIRKSGGSQRRPVDRDVVRVAAVPQQNVDFSILRRFKSIEARLRDLRSIVRKAGHLGVDILKIDG